MNASDIPELAGRVRAEIGKGVLGQAETVDLMLTALFSRGHLLLEGPPGAAKTFLAQCLAAALGLDYGRIQFTPDLMPGDVLGANLYNFQTGVFSLRRGPIFCELLLADEINRTPPKTQAALLEAMQERHVTLDGKAEPLSPRFMVVATQNPIEHQGTYPLPEAQLDRFLFKQTIAYPSEAEERAIVAAHGSLSGQPDPKAMGVTAVLQPEALDAARAVVSTVRLSEEIIGYIVALVRATRESADIQTGASPRAAAQLAVAARAHACLEGRDYVVPDDVKRLALPALRHRVVLSPGAEIDRIDADKALLAIVERIEAPR